MRIKIEKSDGFKEYELPLEKITLLEALTYIKTKVDPSLTFSSGCRSSVCGSCAMRVNEKEVLACAYKLEDADSITALKNMPVMRDLLVDMDKAYSFNAKAKAWLIASSDSVALDHDDEKINEVQSDCILCSSCYSACPVYSVNGEFIGPFSLTRLWRYVSDKREDGQKEKVDAIQTDGIWDCTLCNECTVVCPQNISSKADIEKLRAKSASYGYMDPNFGSFGGGFGSFDGSPVF